MTAGDMPNGIGHCQHRQAEGEGNADESDAEVGEAGREHRRTTTRKHQPECSKELGRDTPRHIHGCLLSLGSKLRSLGCAVMPAGAVSKMSLGPSSGTPKLNAVITCDRPDASCERPMKPMKPMKPPTKGRQLGPRGH